MNTWHTWEEGGHKWWGFEHNGITATIKLSHTSASGWPVYTYWIDYMGESRVLESYVSRDLCDIQNRVQEYIESGQSYIKLCIKDKYRLDYEFRKESYE